MEDKILQQYQGPSIKINGECYLFVGETTAPVDTDPSEIGGTYDSCLECALESSSSESSESFNNVSSSSSSSSRGFTPAELTLLGWYDAADTDTITDSGGSVSQWDDKSGNDYHLTQGTGAEQPTTGATTQNGLNVIDFDGDDSIAIGSGAYLQNVPSAMILTVHKNDVITGTNILFEVYQNSGSTRLKHQVEAGDLGTAGRRLDSDSYLEIFWQTTDTDPHMFVSIADWANAQVYSTYDGTLSGPTAFQTAGNTSNTASQGMGVADRATERLDGYICEIIVIENDITTDTRQKLEGYLAWKWGLEDNLPLTHPYKGAAP